MKSIYFASITIKMYRIEMMRERVEELERKIKKMEKTIEDLQKSYNEFGIDYYSPSKVSDDSLEFREFSDEDIWEINKNENKECNECGSIDIEKDKECEGDIYVFWCNNCNCHVGVCVNVDVDEKEYDCDEFEFCEECEFVGCKCKEMKSIEIKCKIGNKRNRETDDEINLKRIRRNF